jgi:hypothetical protein
MNDDIIWLAEFTARNKSEQDILDLLKIRNGNPDPNWDEDDLQAFEEVRKAYEFALQLKRNLPS